MKQFRINPVVDLREPFRRYPDLADQVPLEVLGKRDVLMDEWPHEPTDTLIFHVTAVEVTHVAPVLTMDTGGHSGKPRRHLHGKGREIPRMHDARPELPQELPDLDIETGNLSGWLVERITGDVRPLYTLPEIGVVRDAHDGVTISPSRQVVDEIDEAVFHPSGLQAVDHVGNQGPAVGGGFGPEGFKRARVVPP